MKKTIILVLALIIMSVTSSYADPLNPYLQGYIEGFIKNITPNIIKIEEYDGTVYELFVDANTRYVIDKRPAVLKDFKPGMEINAELRGKSIKYLESYSTEIPGYIPPGGKVRRGVVKKIDRDQIMVQLHTGETKTYFTSPATIVLKNGVSVPLSSLYEGDNVKLLFDEIDSVIISSMLIEGDSVIVKKLYRGQIGIYDEFENSIVVENIEELKNGKWSYVMAAMRISHSHDTPLYIGGQKIPFRYLKYFRGKRIYLAVKDFFGKERIARMVVKNRYESTYSDKIREINWYTETLELSNNKNLRFYGGTIIVKHGRLVDKYSINPGSDAFIVAEVGEGGALADLIYIYNEAINNSSRGQHCLFAGRLQQIIAEKLLLEDFFLLDKNEWEAFEDEKELWFDNDTYIYDLEAQKQITPQEFVAGDYAVDEDTDYARENNLKDWYGYVYTDGDRVMAAMVKKDMDSLLRQRVTTGVVEVVEEDPFVGWTLKLRDARDWSSIKQKWVLKNSSVRINLEKAMIIKQQQVITPEDLQVGDRLYIVRDDFEGKVVIVK